MDRIIIRGEMFGPFQHIYAYVNSVKVESIGVSMENLEEVVFALLDKYNLSHIDLSGSRMFMQGIEHSIKEKAVTQYSKGEITFRYV
jgi:hypothetical protein